MAERSPFKGLEDVFKCDVRNTYMVLTNKKTGLQRPYDLDEHHKSISKVIINEDVPVEVRDQYNLAKNLCLYGWYVYDFGMASKLYSYIALETALKIKFEKHTGNPPKRSGLKYLVKWAINTGFIKDGGFGHLLFEEDKELLKQIPEWSNPHVLADREGTEYSVGPFLTAVASLRNSLGHGSSMLLPPIEIVGTLHINADAINQLFPDLPA